MKRIKIHLFLLFGFFLTNTILAQKVLEAEEAVILAIENNLGIQLIQNAADLAKNNTSIYNSGKLPTVALDGGYNYNLDNTEANFQDGRTTNLSFASSRGFNASVGINYTIFDGFFRKYNMLQLQEQYALSQLEVEAIMENIAAQTLTQYYQIATLAENLTIIEEAINISARRLERAEQQFEFGQGGRLEILNAQVDLNNDSISYYDTDIQYQNAKRLLNNILVDMQTIDYTVDGTTEFISNLSKAQLETEMLNENLAITQIDKSIEIGNISIDLVNARKLPSFGASLAYGYTFSKNNSASFLSSLNNNGLTAGVTFSWNIFDGGTTRHALAQAQLNIEGLALQKDQILNDLKFDFDNAWANYQNRLFIYNTNLKNVEINRANFERTEEQFKIGQINSVEYRQAQLNLLNAETALNTSKFQVKISEIELLLLSGRIMD